MILRILLLLSATLLSAHEMTHSYEYLRELIFHGEGKMEIKQGSKNYLEISADPALLGNIEILDKQGVLTIHPTSADFKAKLTVKHLEKITLFGFFLIFAFIPCINDIEGSNRFKSWSLYKSKSSIFLRATPLFMAATATAAGITLISLGSNVEGIM